MIPNFSKKPKFFPPQGTPLSNTNILPPLTIRTDKQLLSLKYQYTYQEKYYLGFTRQLLDLT